VTDTAFLQAFDESITRMLIERKKLPTIVLEIVLVLCGGLSFDLKKELDTLSCLFST
jgi:hypothetical protein